MKEYRVFLKSGMLFTEPIKYVLLHISKNQNIKFIYVDKEGAELVFNSNEDDNHIPVASEFFSDLMLGQQFSSSKYFQKDCIIRDRKGQIDYLATIFYMMNCFQELFIEDDSYDQFGRFRYEKSYQYNFNNIEDNLVQNSIDSFCKLYIPGHKLQTCPSRIFYSHDIDTVNGALFQDGFWALKHRRIDVILKLMLHAILLNPDWRNMDKIMKINDEYEIKSTFFWLVNKGRGSLNIMNADYRSSNLKNTMITIENNGFFNGLHKSCTDETISEEVGKLPLKTTYTRYHFLRFKVPEIWDNLEESGIKVDFSLGFAEHYGFRNSFGVPFKPYNLKTGSAYSFLEVPLNMMDSTYSRYLKIPKNQTANEIISFIEKNKINSILSLLWHNTYFSQYKYQGYLEEYKKVISYLHEINIRPVTPMEILSEFNYGE